MDTTEIEGIKASIEEAKKKMEQAGHDYIKKVTAHLFDKYPELESFGWVQYTPYFNDGEACVFGVYLDDYYININGSTLEDLQGESVTANYHFHRYWDADAPALSPEQLADNEEYDRQVEEFNNSWPALAAKEVTELLEPMADQKEFFQRAFGDHCTVTMTKDGYESEYYEHD